MKDRPAPAPADSIATVIITVEIKSGQEHRYYAWQKQMNLASAKFVGYMDSEVIMPAADQDQDTVTVVYRFASSKTLKEWLDSDVRRDLLAEAGDAWKDVRQVAAASGGQGECGATMVVSHDVPEGGIDEFLDSMDELQRLESSYPGYLGVTLLEPVPGVQPQWTSLVRFDNKEHLEGWLQSADREKALQGLKGSGTKYDTEIVGSSFGSWFSFNMRDGVATPNWKQWLVVLLALYPTVMLLGFVTEYLPGGAKNTVFPPGEWFFANMWVGNFLSTLLLSFALMPVVTRALRWWLTPEVATRVTVWGTLLVILLFVVSMGVFAVACPDGCSVVS